ncbi:MAG: rRNA pseudouridine synthase [Methylobacteriaceae bacterium]|nr:rRNA pseudouridine synthase [Methylobacteriaceae bacterium]MBV9245367.1 rRNA pseudouridine synthase [Methylobacteriaceae bacterium]
MIGPSDHDPGTEATDRPRRPKKPPFPSKRKGGNPNGKRQKNVSRTRPRHQPGTVERSADEARIAKVIARAGLCSRRDAEQWIAAGRVALNGKVLTSSAQNVSAQDVILIDGEPLRPRERTRLFLFHKPRGLVTTQRDPEGRPTIFGALPATLPRLMSVGRLDINTEGLLLLTNDGGLARVLELPATGWLRRYRVRANGRTTQEELDRLRDGLTVEGVTYDGIEATLDRIQGANVWLTVGLREGKNREVKRVLEDLGLAVNRLIRTSFGPFQLGGLAEGAIEEVKTRIIRDQLGPDLAKQAGVDLDGPVADPPATRTREDGPRQRPARGRPPHPPGVTGRDGPERLGKRTAPTRGVTADRREDVRPRPARPKPRPHRHVSVMRAEQSAKTVAGRKRIERGETTDRSGRAVSVERVVRPSASIAAPKPGRPGKLQGAWRSDDRAPRSNDHRRQGPHRSDHHGSDRGTVPARPSKPQGPKAGKPPRGPRPPRDRR